MATVEIYTTPYCPFCIRAKKLLKKRAVDFVEIDVAGDREKRTEMSTRAGGAGTVPQIFIDGIGIGGCDELLALDRDGALDRLLAGSAAATSNSDT